MSIAEICKQGFDDGDVVRQYTIPIDRADTYATLSHKLSLLSVDMVKSMLDGDIHADKVKQDVEMMSYAPKFDRNANVYRIADRSDRSVQSFYNIYRAFNGSSLKTAKLVYDNKHVFIDDCNPLSDMILEEHQKAYTESVLSFLLVGSVFVFNNIKKLRGKLAIRFEDGWLIVNRLHFADGQTMTGKVFIKLLNAEDMYKTAVEDINAGKPPSGDLIKFE